ncbi:MAG: hypothetical protein MR270_00875 [Erysipelotrichaceae bacterium]|nr:hypothetical protein [Erysipelotrichaceae bacterium]
MYEDQRLIPFLGGLIVGGAAGTAFDNKNMPYYQQPYNYNYPYPYYANNYNYISPYVNQGYGYYYYNEPIISSSNKAGKIINEQPIDVSLYNNQLYRDISRVPKYQQY